MTHPLKIGLLGGSFNPVHQGHLALSLYARDALGLDQVWWIVARQNPLKSTEDMQPFSQRVALARAVAAVHPWLEVSEIEDILTGKGSKDPAQASCYTADLIDALQKSNPEVRFVWLMGADNLAKFHEWQRWNDIFQAVPIAVFRRKGYDCDENSSPAALRFAPFLKPTASAPDLALQSTPAWMILDNPENPLSATQIRQQDRDYFLKE